MKKVFTILTVFAALSLSAQNLLVNPSFEAGLAPWAAGTPGSYTAPEVSTTGSQDGNQHVTYTNATATTGFYQNIPVTAGETYTISFWYKADGDGTDARIWSVYKNADNQAVYTTEDASTDEFRTNNGYLENSAEWKFHTATMPAGEGAVSLDVAFRAYTGSTVSFDNIVASGSMSVSDVNNFKNSVKMNTVVTDKLTLKLAERSTVNIYTAEGKLVSSNRVDNGGSINTQALAKGFYIVTVSNGVTTVSQKIVKK